MKTFLLIVAMWTCFFVYACNKDQPKGYGKEEYCNCGIVCSDSIATAQGLYLLSVENECSGNEKLFIVDQLVYNAYFVGDRICINDEQPW